MCNKNNPCSSCNPCNCTEDIHPGNCPVKDLSTDCVLYTGEPLKCVGVEKNTILTKVIEKLDALICKKIEDVTQYFSLKNIGLGAKVYKGISGTGEKEIRTVLSSTPNLLSIDEGEEEISISAGVPNLTIEGDNLSLEVSVGTETTVFSTVELPQSTFSQVQANYLEEDPLEASFIENKNPSKTIMGNYTIVSEDNNKIIEIDNGDQEVLISLGSVAAITEFFVGFIQKGTGNVSFTGYDIKPYLYSSSILGQGHPAAFEIIGGTKYIFGTFKKE